MKSYSLEFETRIDLENLKADVSPLMYTSAFFFISIRAIGTFNAKVNKDLPSLEFKFDKKLYKNELAEKIERALFLHFSTLSENDAQVLADQIATQVEKTNPNILKRSWAAHLSDAKSQVKNYFTNILNQVLSFKFRNLYIPRRYVASPTWGGTLFRSAMAGLFASTALNLGLAVGLGPLACSIAVLSSSLSGYTWFAYAMQASFYGEIMSHFKINAETNELYQSNIEYRGLESKTPYLCTIAGVEQELAHLLTNEHDADNSPKGIDIKKNKDLLARYHAHQAAKSYPKFFYPSEQPKQEDMNVLEQEVRHIVPNYAV